MNTQKWILVVAGVILLLGAIAVAAFTFLTPYALAQGPDGWFGPGNGSGPMFGRGFGPRFGMGPGNGPMFNGGFGPGFGMGPGGFGMGPGNGPMFGRGFGPRFGMGPGNGPMFNGGFGPGFGMGPGGGRGWMMGMPGGWGGPENSLISIAAEKLGLTTDELITELQAGKTIADLAAEKNVSVDTIVEAVITPRADQLKELVANGQLTQAEADAMLTLMRANLTRRVNEAWSPRGGGFGFNGGSGLGHPGLGMWGGRRGGNALVTVAAEELGLTRAELLAELQAGKSIADVAAEKNISVDTIAEAILAPRADRLNDLVAAGQLTQEEVDNRLAIQRVDLIDWLNRSWTSQNVAPNAGESNQPESN